MSEVGQWIKDHKIEEVESLVPDMTGNARGRLIPAKNFVSHESRFPEALLLMTVNGEELEDHFDLLGNEIDQDMMLTPDPNSICWVPWAKSSVPTAQVINDCYCAADTLHPLASRSVLRRVIELYRKRGWQAVVAPEAEFYFVEKNIDPNLVLRPPIGRDGRSELRGQGYSVDAINQYEEIIDDIYAWCEKMELDVGTLTHESGPAQFEINFTHGDPLSMADQIFLFKRTTREAALKHNIYATFMAKPMEDEPGSAMHIHQSVIDIKTGRNIFTDDQGEESKMFHHFIGGLQRYTPEFLALYAPNVNSFRRMHTLIDAPANLFWGYDNRLTGLRVPISLPENRRVENRFPGIDCNPYLAIAASLLCGYLGIMRKINPDAPVNRKSEIKIENLAQDLPDALEKLLNSEIAGEVLGEQFVKSYCSIKQTEYRYFYNVISSWERKFLLSNV